MFLSYNLASDRGVASLFLASQRGHSLDIDSATPFNTWMIIWRGKTNPGACFRNLLGLATRMLHVMWRVTVEDLTTFDWRLHQADERSIN